MTKPRIVLLHATPVAMDPISSAFASQWSDAEFVNLLDDGLTIDRAKISDLSDELIERFMMFGRYAHKIGADGILVTCSAFGPAIERMADELPIPVLKPNEAMFRAALRQGSRIGMLATFAPSVGTMRAEFDAFAAESGTPATLDVIVVDEAIDLLRKGDVESHNQLVAERATDFANYDAVMLAHFSTSRAFESVRSRIDVPVLTAPIAAVDRMKELVGRAFPERGQATEPTPM